MTDAERLARFGDPHAGIIAEAMTNPADDAALIERLLEREYRNGGESDDWPELVNPDGPDAVNRLTALNAENNVLQACWRAESESNVALNAELSERIEEGERLRKALQEIAASKVSAGSRYNERLARERERLVDIARAATPSRGEG